MSKVLAGCQAKIQGTKPLDHSPESVQKRISCSPGPAAARPPYMGGEHPDAYGQRGPE